MIDTYGTLHTLQTHNKDNDRTYDMGTVKCVNDSPSKTLVSVTLSPQEIVEGQLSPDCRKIILKLRTYVHLYNVTVYNQRCRAIETIEVNT